MITPKEIQTVDTRIAERTARSVVERKKPLRSLNPTWRMVAEEAFRAGCLINSD